MNKCGVWMVQIVEYRTGMTCTRNLVVLLGVVRGTVMILEAFRYNGLVSLHSTRIGRTSQYYTKTLEDNLLIFAFRWLSEEISTIKLFGFI
ncbi:unnamed protein product [Larinioides sclopetarius]|uniref:Uncharacterized protein n=1 Tax=Larinioides sclopetarius TaxID=280406 RepID=A0AAV1ZM32_9ARAC